MDIEKLKCIIEAAVMVAEAPLSSADLLALFADDGDAVTAELIDTALGALTEDYAGRGIELVKVASGYRFQARKEHADYVNRLFETRPQRYSRALLETLAIIAYRQPVTRAEIESIRGVAVSTNIIKTLSDREWIRVAGHRDVPGRPAVYATTRSFLDYFGLASVSELPALPEMRDVDEIDRELFPQDTGGIQAALAEPDALADGDVEAETGMEAEPATEDEAKHETVAELASESEAGAQSAPELGADAEHQDSAAVTEEQSLSVECTDERIEVAPDADPDPERA